MDKLTIVLLFPGLMAATALWQGYLVWAGAIDMTRSLLQGPISKTKEGTNVSAQDSCPVAGRGL